MISVPTASYPALRCPRPLLLLSLLVSACQVTDGDGGDDRSEGRSGQEGGSDSGKGEAGNATEAPTSADQCADDEATAFEATPVSVQLPPSRCNASYSHLSWSDELDYMLLSLTDSGNSSSTLDLIVMRDDCDDSTGVDQWDVYTLSGFPDSPAYSSTPTAFALPPLRCEMESWSLLRQNEKVQFQTIDVTGDGMLDLVVTRDECDDAVGSEHFDVYVGNSDGFASTPFALGLPAVRCSTPWHEAIGNWSNVVAQWVQLAGRSRASLVVTRDECDQDVGEGHWDVYDRKSEAAEADFSSTPLAYTLPTARCAQPFDAIAGFNAVEWMLTHLDDPSSPGLLVFSDTCDTDIGSKSWDFYAGNVDGFTGNAEPIDLPTLRCGDDSWYPYPHGSRNVQTTFMTLDGLKRELVVTEDNCDSAVGTEQWDVYRLGESGFAASPDTITLPTVRCGGTWNTISGDGNDVSYGFTSLAACQPGLVVTSDPCDDSAGVEQWDAYLLQ